MRLITISDPGMCASVEMAEDGTLRVIQSGGCDVLQIIGDWMDPDMSNDAIAAEVIDSWGYGYDGDPQNISVGVAYQRAMSTSAHCAPSINAQAQ